MSISSAPLNGSGSGEAFIHSTASTANSAALSAAPSAGDVLILCASAGQNSQSLTNITQTGVTWTKILGSTTSLSAEVWKGIVGPGASATINITSAVTGSTVNIRYNVSRWSGSPSVNDASGASNSGAATTSVASASLTPTAGKNVLLIIAARAQNGGFSAPGGGFTALTSGSTGYAFAYQVVASASGSYQATYTQTSGTYETVLAAITVPAPALICTTQPGSSVNSGASPTLVFKATTDGSTIDTSFVGNVTIAKGSGVGTLGGTLTVAAVAGVATFSAETITGDGGGWSVTASAAGYNGVTTNTFSVVGTALAANQAFVAANGGDAVWPAIYDRRLNVGVSSAKVATWDDAIGTLSGRTPGPQLAQSTAGLRPDFVGTQGSGTETITLTGASSQCLQSVTDSRFQFSPSTPLFVVAIYEATGTGPIAGVAADPTSSVVYPYALLQGGGTAHKGDFAAEGVTTGRVQPTSNVAFADATARVAMIGKGTRIGGGNGGGDENWRYFFAGKQIRRHSVVTVATAGNLAVTVGRIGTTYGNGKLHWLGITTQDPSRANWLALIAFGLAQHGAQADTTKRNTLILPGDSLRYGSQSTDPMTPAVGTGTKSAPYIMATTVSGARSDLATQGLDVGDVHGFNYGVSGRTVQQIVDTFDAEIAPNVDGCRTGQFVVIARGIGNYVQNINATISQLRTVAAALRDKVHALGGKLYWETEVDRGAGANGTNGNATGWYLSGPAVGVGLSANGTVVTTFNTDLRANDGSYGDGYVEMEADGSTRMQINRAGTLACNDTTYFNADKVHGQDALYSLMGGILKTYLDANDAVLYPRLAVHGGLRGGFLSSGGL